MMWRVETSDSLYGLQTVIAEEVGESPGVYAGSRFGAEARIGASRAQIRAVRRRLTAGGHKVAITRINLGDEEKD